MIFFFREFREIVRPAGNRSTTFCMKPGPLNHTANTASLCKLRTSNATIYEPTIGPISGLQFYSVKHDSIVVLGCRSARNSLKSPRADSPSVTKRNSDKASSSRHAIWGPAVQLTGGSWDEEKQTRRAAAHCAYRAPATLV